METQYYSIKDFEDLVFDTTYRLSSEIMQIIHSLEKEIQIVDSANDSTSNQKKTMYVDKKKQMGSNRRSDNNNGKYNKGAKEISNNDWEALRSFKSTKMDVKQGIDKNISDIRVLLNKISNKNYDTQKEVIKSAISEFMNEVFNTGFPQEILDVESRKRFESRSDSVRFTPNASEDSKTIIEKFSKDLFNIMSTNKFFSELYTNLYKELLTDFDFLSEHFLQEITAFKHTIDNIQYCDPNIDYDNFCNYTKINDTRRATTMFIVNMFKNNIIGMETVLDILHYFLQKSLEFIDTENKINEVEEITENIYLIVSNCHVLFDDCNDSNIWSESHSDSTTKSGQGSSEAMNPTTNSVGDRRSPTEFGASFACKGLWKDTILPIIIQISQMKLKDHASLSNRFLFKYMDIIDSLE